MATIEHDIEKRNNERDHSPVDSNLGVVKELEEHGELVTVDNGVSEALLRAGLHEDEQTRILRKVDYRLLPLLTFLYLIAFVDRTNSKSWL
jgi:hypothetical protein